MKSSLRKRLCPSLSEDLLCWDLSFPSFHSEPRDFQFSHKKTAVQWPENTQGSFRSVSKHEASLACQMLTVSDPSCCSSCSFTLVSDRWPPPDLQIPKSAFFKDCQLLSFVLNPQSSLILNHRDFPWSHIKKLINKQRPQDSACRHLNVEASVYWVRRISLLPNGAMIVLQTWQPWWKQNWRRGNHQPC